MATDACKSGKIAIADTRVKPSTSVEVGQKVRVQKNGFNLEFKVLKLIEKRVGAPIAVTCYEDLTPAEELNKYNAWYVGKARPEQREKGAGRPTKRERRKLEGFKDEERFIEED